MNRNNYLLRNRNIYPLRCGSGSGNGKKTFYNVHIQKKHIGHLIGRGAPELLLSEDLGASSIGNGFGVKTPNKNLLKSLEKLNIGSHNNKHKNIRLIL